jgi:phosphoribosylanthranilate isomerase
LKVKVCGITGAEDARLCEKQGADALGFIFYEGSKRNILPNDAKKIIETLSPFTLKVGVFVNESYEKIVRIVKYCGLNMVQLHGNESPELVDMLNVPVIKAFRVNESFDFSELERYRNCYFLLDSYSKDEFGGTGSTFNWQVIPESIRSKVILAGGISVENVGKIVEEINPVAIDISSGLESSVGKKDAEKVKTFFNRIKTIEG